MQICFFEDSFLTRFHPLTLTRPLDDLRLGILTIAEKWKRALDVSSFSRIVRNELEGIFEKGTLNPSESCIWINSRYLPEAPLLKEVQQLNTGTCLQVGSSIIAAHVEGSQASQWLETGTPDFKTLLVIKSSDFLSVSHLWDLYHLNAQQIHKDIELLNPHVSQNVSIAEEIALENSDRIFIEEGVTIEPGVFISAKEGPVYLGKDAIIMMGATLRGPLAVCEGSTVKMGARIYGGTTIGPTCKIGGEVDNTIFHSYSNKAHDGYIGNSVVGQWCNLGAGTMISNLKINYGNIRITDWKTGNEIETDQQFLGLIMGDHCKTAINCVINSGSVYGVNTNILSREFPPKFIPSFSWVGSTVIQRYKLEKAYEAMEAMMARRDVPLTDAYSQLMKYLFEQSKRQAI